MTKIILILGLLPIWVQAQTVLPNIGAQTQFQAANSRQAMLQYQKNFEQLAPDSLIFYGDSTTLKVFPKRDSVVVHENGFKPVSYMGASLIIDGNSPSTYNHYGCMIFGGSKGDVFEYTYNPRSGLWGFLISYNDGAGKYKQDQEGMPIWRPFPPVIILDVITRPIKPQMSGG